MWKLMLGTSWDMTLAFFWGLSGCLWENVKNMGIGKAVFSAKLVCSATGVWPGWLPVGTRLGFGDI